MPSFEMLVKIAENPAYAVEERDFETEFNEIVKGTTNKPSFAAKVLNAAGVELEEFSKDTLTTFAASVDAGVVTNSTTSYDNKFMYEQQDQFLSQRELDYATVAEGDPDFIG